MALQTMAYLLWHNAGPSSMTHTIHLFSDFPLLTVLGAFARTLPTLFPMPKADSLLIDGSHLIGFISFLVALRSKRVPRNICEIKVFLMPKISIAEEKAEHDPRKGV